MIQVIVTHIQGIELATTRTIAIDEEKIVDARRRGIFTEISYAESYDRKWETITYQITAALPNIQAAIQGDWVGKEYLSGTVEWGEPREMRPNIWETTYALDIQQKFIVDIEEVYYRFPWSTTDELVTKLRYTSSAFLQKVVYVTEHLHDLVPDVPSATTTTTTAEPATTTTTEMVTTTTEPATTTTTEAATTTTTWGGCFEYTITNLDEQLPLMLWGYPCEGDCMPVYVYVEYGSPVTACYCYPPLYLGGSEFYSVVRGAACEVTTTTTEIPTVTTTECIPDGIPIGIATSITPVLGGETLAFQASEENACSALWYVTNEEQDWIINWFDGKVVPGQPYVWWDSRTCELLDGYYMVWDDGYKIYWFSSGIQGTLLECTTTTTELATTTTTEIGTTTTTEELV